MKQVYLPNDANKSATANQIMIRRPRVEPIPVCIRLITSG